MLANIGLGQVRYPTHCETCGLSLWADVSMTFEPKKLASAHLCAEISYGYDDQFSTRFIESQET